jgi:hypothetical protein
MAVGSLLQSRCGQLAGYRGVGNDPAGERGSQDSGDRQGKGERAEEFHGSILFIWTSGTALELSGRTSILCHKRLFWK